MPKLYPIITFIFFNSTHFRGQNRIQIILYVFWFKWEQENLFLEFTDLYLLRGLCRLIYLVLLPNSCLQILPKWLFSNKTVTRHSAQSLLSSFGSKNENITNVECPNWELHKRTQSGSSIGSNFTSSFD